jgi:hypothetical protein
LVWVLHSPRRLAATGGVALIAALAAGVAVADGRPAGDAAATPPDVPAATAVGPSGTPDVPAPDPEDYGDGDAAQAAERAAREFLDAWTGAAAAASQQAWLDALAPATTPQLLAGLASTDRAVVPGGPPESLATAAVGDHVAEYAAVLAGGVGVVVLVVDDGTRWAVADIQPAG